MPVSTVRFIHTADIHLDSPLQGLAAYPDAPVAQLRTATRDAFDNLVGEALAEQVDFMVIAGDLYDGGWKDFNTGLFFARQMGRLKAAGIPVYLLLGNHDAESEMTRQLVLPDNVHRFPTGKAGTFELPALQVALHGRSFKEAATTENLVLGYPAPVPGWLNIGVLHTALEGNAAHASYAPCSLAELQARGYQYWALGHVHEAQQWQLPGCTVAFPGNLQGRHVRESGPRGALLVTAEDGQVQSLAPLHCDVLRWQALSVDASAAHSLADAVQAAGLALQDLLTRSDARRPLAVRLSFTGASPAHGQLFGLQAQLRQEVLAQAVTLGAERLWIEKVRVDTQPAEATADLAARSDALADLQALLAQAEADPALLQALQDDLAQLVGKLPMALLQTLPQLALWRQGDAAGQVQALVRETTPSLIAQLAQAD